MSAERLGERLLAEVGEESLDQVVIPNSRSILGIKPLDQVLETVRYPPVEPPSRHLPWTSPSSTFNDADDEHQHGEREEFSPRSLRKNRQTLVRPPIIGITSFESSTGKTSLIYLISSISALPFSHGGKETTVVWLDTDGRFSALRLSQVMRNYLHGTCPALDDVDIDFIIRHALRHIHVFRPTSSFQLLQTLHNLPRYVLAKDENGFRISGARQLGLIVLDSATAFYWQDRLDVEMERIEALNHDSHTANKRNSKSNSNTTSRAGDIIKVLKTLQSDFDCTLIFTNSPLFPAMLPPKPPIHHQSPANTLTKSQPETSLWSTLATLTISLSRPTIPQFANHMSIEECLVDRERRLEVVRRGRVVGTFHSQFAASNRLGSVFGFCVTAKGVEMDPAEVGSIA